MVLSIYTLLGSHHHCPSPQLFSFCKIKTLYLLSNNFPVSPHPNPWQPITIIFLSQGGFDHPKYLVWRRQWHPTHSNTLAWKIPWMEEPGRLQSMGSDTTERLHFHFSLSCIGDGNGNPLQCSCLENPRDGGVWWAAVCGVAQSQTRLK